MTIRQEDINRILQERRHVLVTFNAEDQTYLLTMEAGGESDGEEGTAETGENR